MQHLPQKQLIKAFPSSFFHIHQKLDFNKITSVGGKGPDESMKQHTLKQYIIFHSETNYEVRSALLFYLSSILTSSLTSFRILCLYGGLVAKSSPTLVTP